MGTIVLCWRKHPQHHPGGENIPVSIPSLLVPAPSPPVPRGDFTEGIEDGDGTQSRVYPAPENSIFPFLASMESQDRSWSWQRGEQQSPAWDGGDGIRPCPQEFGVQGRKTHQGQIQVLWEDPSPGTEGAEGSPGHKTPPNPSAVTRPPHTPKKSTLGSILRPSSAKNLPGALLNSPNSLHPTGTWCSAHPWFHKTPHFASQTSSSFLLSHLLQGIHGISLQIGFTYLNLGKSSPRVGASPGKKAHLGILLAPGFVSHICGEEWDGNMDVPTWCQLGEHPRMGIFIPNSSASHPQGQQLPTLEQRWPGNKNSLCFRAGREQKMHPCFILISQSESDLQGFFASKQPSCSLEQSGPHCPDPALFGVEVEKLLCPFRARSTGKVPQETSQDPSKKCTENPGFGIPQAPFSSLNNNL